MKKIVIIGWLIYLAAVGIPAMAQNINKEELTKVRADRLSDQMIQELRLNNFQAKKLRAINQEKVSEMIKMEQTYASDPALADKKCQGICQQRDKELEAFLSSDQYSQYYGNRSEFYKYDKDFARKIGWLKSNKQSNSLNKTIATEGSLQKVTRPDPVIKPTMNR